MRIGAFGEDKKGLFFFFFFFLVLLIFLSFSIRLLNTKNEKPPSLDSVGFSCNSIFFFLSYYRWCALGIDLGQDYIPRAK